MSSKLFLITTLLNVWIFASQIKINLISTNDIHGVIATQEATFMNPLYPPTIVGGEAFKKK